jgi:hypothetical protein
MEMTPPIPVISYAMRNATRFLLSAALLVVLNAQAQFSEPLRTQWLRGSELFELDLFSNSQANLTREVKELSGLEAEYANYQKVIGGL